jgi:hypothetical protein
VIARFRIGGSGDPFLVVCSGEIVFAVHVHCQDKMRVAADEEAPAQDPIHEEVQVSLHRLERQKDAQALRAIFFNRVDAFNESDQATNVKRASYVMFRNESGNGAKGINNNYCGAQADSGRWQPESKLARAQ